MITEPPLIPQW